ncbi:MAG: hypothetical protein ACI9UA_001957 [Pseudoalteromonas tetraodonis]
MWLAKIRLANSLIEATEEIAKATGKVVRDSKAGGLLNHYRRAT